jgi:hypothetical protein
MKIDADKITYKIIGFEGSEHEQYNLNYGAGAILSSDGQLINAVSKRATKFDQKEFDKMSITKTEVEIDIPDDWADKDSGLFVFYLKNELAEREPYFIDPNMLFMHRIISIGKSKDKTYYIFRNLDSVSLYLNMLHFSEGYSIKK